MIHDDHERVMSVTGTQAANVYHSIRYLVSQRIRSNRTPSLFVILIACLSSSYQHAPPPQAAADVLQQRLSNMHRALFGIQLVGDWPVAAYVQAHFAGTSISSRILHVRARSINLLVS